jgi:hypothetical protein
VLAHTLMARLAGVAAARPRGGALSPGAAALRATLLAESLALTAALQDSLGVRELASSPAAAAAVSAASGGGGGGAGGGDESTASDVVRSCLRCVALVARHLPELLNGGGGGGGGAGGGGGGGGSGRAFASFIAQLERCVRLGVRVVFCGWEGVARAAVRAYARLTSYMFSSPLNPHCSHTRAAVSRTSPCLRRRARTRPSKQAALRRRHQAGKGKWGVPGANTP